MSWRKAVRIAEFEKDPAILSQRVLDAETAIAQRRQSSDPIDPNEEQDLQEAGEILLKLKTEKIR